jgi:hypothetical protein
MYVFYLLLPNHTTNSEKNNEIRKTNILSFIFCLGIVFFFKQNDQEIRGILAKVG